MNNTTFNPLIAKRIDAFRKIMSYGGVINGDLSCLDQIRKQVTENIVVQKRIGSSSVNKEAYLGVPDDISVKLIPLKSDEVMYIRDHTHNPKAWEKALWAELLFMQICSYVVKMAKIPHLPMAYAYMFCNSCRFDNEMLNHTLPPQTSCLLLLNEFPHGDFTNWIQTERSIKEWSLAYFQIFVGLYFLQKFFNMTHHDLHWGNVLVHPSPRGGYSMYQIDGKKYYMPNLGFCCVLSNFGYARIPGKVEIGNQQAYYNNSEFGQMPRLLVDYFRIAQVPLWMHDPNVPESEKYLDVRLPSGLERDFIAPLTEMFYEGYTLKRVIPKLWGVYTTKPEGVPIIERYDLDSPFKNFPKEHAHLLHDFIREPIPDRVPTSVNLALNAQDLYSKFGSGHIHVDEQGRLEVEEASRDFEDFDPMEID